VGETPVAGVTRSDRRRGEPASPGLTDAAASEQRTRRLAAGGLEESRAENLADQAGAAMERTTATPHHRLLEFAKTALIKIFAFPYATVCSKLLALLTSRPSRTS
jgi:hypothetical protein